MPASRGSRPRSRRSSTARSRKLCAMCNDWEITHERYDLPPHVWQFIKDKGFLGMIIPKKYGGLGFSALAHSAVVMKLSTRSQRRGRHGDGAELARARPSCCCTTAPTSRRTTTCRASPRARRSPASRSPAPRRARTPPRSRTTAWSARARGRARKCSACASPGTSATSRSGPVATLLGLAFRLYDPEHLLGDKEDLGITCALVPTDTPRA